MIFIDSIPILLRATNVETENCTFINLDQSLPI